MKSVKKIGVSAALAAALVLCLGAATAFAGTAGNDTSGKNTMWDIPDKAMTNTVDVDGTTYKVITTWANAWATGGPDYLGVSNSCYLATEGGGTSSASSFEYAQQSTLLGIWATAANESPNAYNWNTYYNLFCTDIADIWTAYQKADFETSSNAWDSTSGVWGTFKYRPEIIWTSNGLGLETSNNNLGVTEAVGYINNGQYYSNTSGTPGTDGYTAPDKSAYYIDGDETYDPYVMSANNQNPYTYTDTFYTLAGFIDQVIADNADKTGTATDWKGMNSLPRTTRYETVGLSAEDCCLNIERVTRGSVYYVLSQIKAGKVKKKKVAFLATEGQQRRAGNDIQTYGISDGGSTVTVNAYDYVENIGNGPNNGYASFSTNVVDQLITDEDVATNQIASESTVGANSSSYNNPVQGSALYNTTSTATADDLLDCDIIYFANGSVDAATIEDWLIANSTDTEDVAKQKAEAVQICSQDPAIMQWSNFTAEKMVYGTFAINFFYPELFPNMELVAYWYDEVYHLKTDSVAVAMGYSFGNADLPAGTSLNDLAESYSKSDIESKFNEGLKYFIENFKTDDTISRVLAGQPIAGSPTLEYVNNNLGEGDEPVTSLSFNGFEPSYTFINSQYDAIAADKAYYEGLSAYVKTLDSEDAAAYSDMLKSLEQHFANSSNPTTTKKGSSAKKQTIKVKGKASVKAGKKVTIKVKSAKTKLAVKVTKKVKKALKVTAKGKNKIVVKALKGAKKGKTYKIKVYAKASGGYAKSNTKTIKVKVK